jgi:hypothetical protein
MGTIKRISKRSFEEGRVETEGFYCRTADCFSPTLARRS